MTSWRVMSGMGEGIIGQGSEIPLKSSEEIHCNLFLFCCLRHTYEYCFLSYITAKDIYRCLRTVNARWPAQWYRSRRENKRSLYVPKINFSPIPWGIF